MGMNGLPEPANNKPHAAKSTQRLPESTPTPKHLSAEEVRSEVFTFWK